MIDLDILRETIVDVAMVFAIAIGLLLMAALFLAFILFSNHLIAYILVVPVMFVIGVVVTYIFKTYDLK